MTDAPRKNWFQRNWPWCVPVGCGGLMLLVGAGIFSILVLVYGFIKSSDPYQVALSRAKANPEVVRALGAPIEEGFFIQGQINISGGSGNANLSIPLTGASGSGTLFISATKQAGTWTFQRLEVAVQGSGERITLPP